MRVWGIDWAGGAAMALIKCEDCGTEVSDTAPACVKCGRLIQVIQVEEDSGGSSLKLLPLVVAGVVGVLSWFYYEWEEEQIVEQIIIGTNDAMGALAEEGVSKYNMARKAGDEMGMCMGAMEAAMAYQQANMENEYLEWAKKQKRACR
jgi:hypothetical protein